MGSINRICDPINWKITFEGKSKVLEGDMIYKAIIGYGLDYQPYEISTFISKINYDNLIDGNYSIKIFPYASSPVVLFNEKKEAISLIMGKEFSYELLNKEQKEYIEKLKSQKTLIKKYSR